MTSFYLVAYGQPNDRAVYVGENPSILENIEGAKKFNSWEDACIYLSQHNELRAMVIEVADVTLQIIRQGYIDFMAGIQSSYREVYHNYNTVSYIMNSR